MESVAPTHKDLWNLEDIRRKESRLLALDLHMIGEDQGVPR